MQDQRSSSKIRLDAVCVTIGFLVMVVLALRAEEGRGWWVPGLLLVGGLAAFLWWAFVQGRRRERSARPDERRR